MKRKTDLSLRDELALLRAKSIQSFIGTSISKSGHEHLKKYVQKRFLNRIECDGGMIFVRRDRKKRLVAALLIGSGSLMPEFKPKKPFWCFSIFSLPGDSKSLEWAVDRLLEQKTLLAQGCDGNIEAWQTSILPRLRALKIYPTSIQLKGRVNTALEKLKEHYGEKLFAPLTEHGLSIRAATTKKEIEAYVQIIKSEFTRNPQFGTFVAKPEFLNEVRTELKKSMKAGQKRLWLVYRGKKILGGVDYCAISKDLNDETKTSFGLNLCHTIHGKHIARCVYATVLNELRKKKVASFGGGTAQPGVMRLAKIMDRKMVGVVVERSLKPLFGRHYFKDWI